MKSLTAFFLLISSVAYADPLVMPPGRNSVAYHDTNNGNLIFATIAEDGTVSIDWAAVTEAAKAPSNSGSAAVAKLLLAARRR